MSNGVIGGRRANESGQEPRLRQREVGNLCTEIHLGCCLHAISVVAKEHGVEIALNNLTFRHSFLEHHRITSLQNLVTTITRQPSEIFVFHYLLRDG